MTTDFRALCARLADELDAYRKMLLDDRNVTHQLADEARAALAEPEIPSESPTDEELRQLRRNHEWPVVDSLLFVIARAVLARWGRPS